MSKVIAAIVKDVILVVDACQNLPSLTIPF